MRNAEKDTTAEEPTPEEEEETEVKITNLILYYDIYGTTYWHIKGPIFCPF